MTCAGVTLSSKIPDNKNKRCLLRIVTAVVQACLSCCLSCAQGKAGGVCATLLGPITDESCACAQREDESCMAKLNLVFPT